MATRLSDRQVDEIRELYTGGKSSRQVAQLCGVSATTVLDALRRINVKRRVGRYRVIQDRQEVSIVGLYAQGLTQEEIAVRFGVSACSVLRCLHRNGVKGRKRLGYSLNETAFDKAENSEPASYYVGLLLADGNVNWRGGDNYAIRLSLKDSDAATVDGFRQFMGSSHPLRFHKRDGNKGPCSLCTFEFCSRSVAAALMSYGVVPRKTGRATVAACMAHSRHFWRGHVDGNGSLFCSRVGIPVISLCGSKYVCQSFLNFAKTLISTKATVRKRKENCHQVSFSSSKTAVIVRELYGNCQVAMQRKLDVANKIISIGRAKGWLSHSKTTV